MRIDAYTHFFPKKFFDKMQDVAGDYKDMGKRVRSLPALFDVDVRKKIVDGHKDYQQILSYPQPPVEKFAKSPAQVDELIRIINDGRKERGLALTDRVAVEIGGAHDLAPAARRHAEWIAGEVLAREFRVQDDGSATLDIRRVTDAHP